MVGTMWAGYGRVMLLSESTFAISCHMNDLNRYRRETSSLFIEIYCLKTYAGVTQSANS